MSHKQLLLIPAFSIFALFAQSCSNSDSVVKTNTDKPIAVTISSTSQQSAHSGIDITGQVESAHSSNIGTRIMGYITKIYVKTGDQVKAGQLLFTVNNSDILAKKSQTGAMLSQAEAALQVAQKDYDRYTALYKQNSASAKELEQVTLQYQSAKANVEASKSMQNEVKAQLTYANVVAPFSGVVTQKLAEEGSLANPGMPIITIEQGGALQVSAWVPESQVASLKIGDKAQMEVASAKKHFDGKVLQINPSSQFSGGQYNIKLSIPLADAKKLFAGMYVKINVQGKELQLKDTSIAGVYIPEAALIYRDQLVGVYTVSEQNTAILRWLRLGKKDGGRIEVLSGLSKDETFIMSAEGKLYNGAPVTIK